MQVLAPGDLCGRLQGCGMASWRLSGLALVTATTELDSLSRQHHHIQDPQTY